MLHAYMLHMHILTFGCTLPQGWCAFLYYTRQCRRFGTPGVRKEECVCDVGFYNEPNVGGEGCHPCPQGAVCQGELAAVQAEPTYWFHPDARNVYHFCTQLNGMPPERCLGGADPLVSNVMLLRNCRAMTRFHRCFCPFMPDHQIVLACLMVLMKSTLHGT